MNHVNAATVGYANRIERRVAKLEERLTNLVTGVEREQRLAENVERSLCERIEKLEKTLEEVAAASLGNTIAKVFGGTKGSLCVDLQALGAKGVDVGAYDIGTAEDGELSVNETPVESDPWSVTFESAACGLDPDTKRSLNDIEVREHFAQSVKEGAHKALDNYRHRCGGFDFFKAEMVYRFTLTLTEEEAQP